MIWHRIVPLTYRDQCAIALVDVCDEITQLLAPVFTRYAAETFAAWYPVSGIDGTPEAELAAAAELRAFIDAWDQAHANDDRFPTPDGQYPKPKLMAEWFGRQQAEKGKVAA